MAADVATLGSADNVQGDSVAISVDGGAVRINDAQVVIADIEASNGVIHVIDSVLLPPEELGSIVDIAMADGRFKTLVTALGTAGLAETLQGDGPFTVFALVPTGSVTFLRRLAAPSYIWGINPY